MHEGDCKSGGQNEIRCQYVAIYSMSLLQMWILAVGLIYITMYVHDNLNVPIKKIYKYCLK